jgi:hypothetical protein
LFAGVCLLLCAGQFSLAKGARPLVKRTPEYNALFQRMYDNPTDVELAFKFAALATKLGDYEGAIGALERILAFNPHLPRVRLQLGQLYFKLGAYKIAQAYFQEARAGGATADIAAQTERFVAEIERREAPKVATAKPAPPPPSEWSLFAQSGIRYQSNATQGPSGVVQSLGLTVPVATTAAKQPDFNMFGLFGVNYVHNLQHGNEDAFEAAAAGYYAKQFRLNAYDFGLFEVQSGPRFSLPATGLSAKPYAIGTVSSLGDAFYFEGAGPGFSVRYLGPSKALAWIEGLVEYRYRTFFDSQNFPTASQQTGGLLSTAVRAAGTIVDHVDWFARVGFDRANTVGNYDFNDFHHVAIDVGFPIGFEVPMWDSKRIWVVTPTFGMGYYNYFQANPTIDPIIVRKDHDWHGGAMVDAQISGRYGLRVQFLYQETRSTLLNFTTNNYSVIVGPTYSF